MKAEVGRHVNRLLQKSNQEVEIQLAVEMGRKWSNSEYILKVESAGYASSMDVT